MARSTRLAVGERENRASAREGVKPAGLPQPARTPTPSPGLPPSLRDRLAERVTGYRGAAPLTVRERLASSFVQAKHATPSTGTAASGAMGPGAGERAAPTVARSSGGHAVE